jgi:hypothetical protein
MWATRRTLLDFIYDRGEFCANESLEGMEASQKSDLFVEHYAKLSQDERGEMNGCLVSALLGRNEETAKFSGIMVLLILSLVRRVPRTGLDAFELDLIQELRNPRLNQSWLQKSEEIEDFRRNWRYALGIINILNELRVPAVRSIVMELASATQSERFQYKLNEVLQRAQ